MIPFVSPFLRKNERKLVKNFLLKFWFWIIPGILLLFYWLFSETRLITGGLLLISIGLKQYLLPGLKKENPDAVSIFTGTLITMLGIFAIITNYLLPASIDAFVFFFLFLVFVLIILYDGLSEFFKKSRILGSLFLLFIAFALHLSISPLIKTIVATGFQNIWFYGGTIMFILLVVFIYFKLIKDYMELLKLKENPYLALALAGLLFVIVGGYFYLNGISENYLRDFLLIISIGFVTTFGAVSSLKSIISNKQ